MIKFKKGVKKRVLNLGKKGVNTLVEGEKS